MKIKTSLPFDISQLQIIQQNGAIVNASDIKFQHLPDEKQIQTALIYIQNTNVDIEFIFNQSTYLIKQQFLIKYLTKKYICNIQQFVETWITILFNYQNKKIFLQKNILSQQEITLFIQKNQQICKQLLQVILSLPQFYISSLNALIDSSIEKNTEIYFNNNIINLIKYNCILQLYDIDFTKYQYYNYTKIFYPSNFNLHSAIIDNTPIATIIFGLLHDKQLINKILNK